MLYRQFIINYLRRPNTNSKFPQDFCNYIRTYVETEKWNNQYETWFNSIIKYKYPLIINPCRNYDYYEWTEGYLQLVMENIFDSNANRIEKNNKAKSLFPLCHDY